jgi:hypothetical protein
MGLFKQKFNAVSGQLNLVPTNTAIRMRDTVSTQANLPLSGNVIGDGRVTTDTGHLYLWNIDNSTGLLTDWIDQGNFIDVSWDSLSGKPSSAVSNIDDAVSKRHTQNSDSKLAEGTANEVTASNAKSAVDLKHTQGTDQGLDTGGLNAVTAAQVKQAVTDDHTHSNKSVLDNIQEALTTILKSAYDGAVSNSHAPHSDDQVIPDQLSDLSDDATHRLVTDTEKSNWNGAVSVQHSHSNKSTLDLIQEALTTSLKSAYDSCVTFITNFALGTPATDDVLAWNGSQFVPKAQQVTGFKGVDLFLDDTATGIGGYFTLSPTPNTAISEQLDNIIVNANTVTGEGYLSLSLGGSQIDAGTWQFDIYRYISSGNTTGTTELIFDIYKRTSGGTETLLFSIATGDVNDTTNVLQSITTVQPAFAINSTDRLLIKVKGHRIEVGNRTITFTHNGTSHYSHLHTPLVLRHNDLAGLQGGTGGEYNHLTNSELNDVQALPEDLNTITLNIMLNAFRIAQIGSLTIFGMVKGFVDEYEDESGVDLVNSINQTYNDIDDYYTTQSVIDSYTKLLLHFDNNVTDFSSTPKTVTNNNITFGSGYFNQASYFDGNPAHFLSVPASNDFNFGSGDFTIDCWAKFLDLNVAQVICGQNDGAPNYNYWLFYYDGTTDGLTFSARGFYSLDILATVSCISDTNWHHIAFVRNGSNWYLFVDGISKSLSVTINSGTSFGFINDTLGIGRIGNSDGFGTGVPISGGYLDEFRISKGIARWTTNFTPLTHEYTGTIENIVLLSNAQTALLVPLSARIVLFEEDVDSVSLNTDLKAYISRDNGTTYSQATLIDEGNYITGARVLSGVVDVSGQPSGTDVKYKIETLNNKNLKIHGTAISWK